jgi:hypothetical protein
MEQGVMLQGKVLSLGGAVLILLVWVGRIGVLVANLSVLCG